MKTYAVYMFEGSNEYTYLVGYYTSNKGETQEQLLDRVAQITGAAMRQHLNIR